MQEKKMDESENGTHDYSSSISTSTKTMIPTLKMFGRGNKKPQTGLNLHTNGCKIWQKGKVYIKQNKSVIARIAQIVFCSIKMLSRPSSFSFCLERKRSKWLWKRVHCWAADARSFMYSLLFQWEQCLKGDLHLDPWGRRQEIAVVGSTHLMTVMSVH